MLKKDIFSYQNKKIIPRYLPGTYKKRKLKTFPKQDILSVCSGLIESVCDGLVIVDSNFKIVKTNKNFLKIVQKDQVVGKYIFDILPDNTFISILKKKFNNDTYLGENIFYFNKRSFKPTISLLGDNLYVIVLQDFTFINTFQSVNKKLKSREKWYKAVVNNIQSGLAIVDYDTRKILDINPELEKILLINKNDIIGKSCYDYLCGGDRRICANIFENNNLEYNIVVKNRDGKDVYLYKKVTALDIEGKKYILESIVDITELKKVEQEYKNISTRLKILFNSLPFLVIAIDVEDKIIEWNPLAEILFGFKREQVVGKNFSEIKDKVKWKETLSLSPNEDSFKLESQMEVRYLRSDGKSGFLDLRFIDFRELPGDGDEKILLIVGNDITEFKVIQSQLSQAQKLEAIGQLAAGIAHEINTPAQYVSDNLYFLSETLEDLTNLIEDLRQCLTSSKNIEESKRILKEKLESMDIDFILEEFPKAIEQSLEGIKRISKIVQSMKQFAHPGSGEEKVFTNLNKAIENASIITKNTWKYVADFELDLEEDLPLVKCYPFEINQVLLNMIVNAADAIKEKVGENASKGDKGKIKITTRKVGDRVRILIEDTGCGIPEDILPKIFEPFFTTKEVGKGTGQGLAISYNIIVEKHKGLLSVQSEVNKGTVFNIEIPIDEE
ncbi:PAS domain S-box-containing protein [Desulfonauticus submarinus]|uniref:histidine kinase n=1 Tax=Desulfonauticus submarinus TaxID=206665 RepID=A0A1G9ZSJ9_9BACT|nr:PAS domain S-box protein [Desulfonauticus submarinus]SDN24200.1 PAS domain S-box-containing protein [Desulfonauticus submarinus]